MDRRKEDSKVAAIPSRINPVRKAAVMREQRKGEPLPASLNSPNPPIKNREISIMSVGNLPLQEPGVCENGDQALSGRVDNPASHNSGCIAAKAHSHA